MSYFLNENEECMNHFAKAKQEDGFVVFYNNRMIDKYYHDNKANENGYHRLVSCMPKIHEAKINVFHLSSGKLMQLDLQPIIGDDLVFEFHEPKEKTEAQGRTNWKGEPDSFLFKNGNLMFVPCLS
jgi:hypothetical protein